MSSKKTTKRDPLPHPSVKKKQDQLYKAAKDRMNKLLYELRNSSEDTERLVDSLADWLLWLIDESACPDTQNIMTFYSGDEDEFSTPCFSEN